MRHFRGISIVSSLLVYAGDTWAATPHREPTNTPPTSPGILCSKVSEVVVTFPNLPSTSHYVCERPPKDTNGVVGVEFPIQTTRQNREFHQSRQYAMTQGWESLYILNGTVSQGVIPLHVESDQWRWFHYDSESDNPIANGEENQAGNPFGDQYVLIVRISAKGVSPGPTADELSEAVFGIPSNSDVSMRSQFQACSDHLLTFAPAAGTTPKGLTIHNGVVEVNVGWTSNMDVYTLTNAAKALIGDTTIYDYVMYDLPTGTTYSGKMPAAFATKPGYQSYYFGDSLGGTYMLLPSVTIHEIGHNLGLGHSNENHDEYEDITCQMGLSYIDRWKNRCFNAAKLTELGWFDHLTVTIDFLKDEGAFSGKLRGVNDVTSEHIAPAFILVLVIENPIDSLPNYYLTLNLAKGFTKDTGEYSNEVVIVEATPGNDSDWSQSNLVGHLDVGETFISSNFLDDRDLQIQVTDIGIDNRTINYASFTVELQSEACDTIWECDSSPSTCDDFWDCDVSPSTCLETLCNDYQSCYNCPNDCHTRMDCNAVSQSLMNRPFRILSNLSTDKEQWCMYPKHNYLSEYTYVALSKCQSWKSYRWIFDYEGKIRNYKDPSLCMSGYGNAIVLYKCQHDSTYGFKWRYTLDQQLITRGGKQHAAIQDRVASEKKHIKILNDTYNGTLADTWILEHVNGDIVPVPSYKTFWIVSDFTWDDTKTCIHPANNYIANGVTLVPSTCKTWKSFQWTMDHLGRLHNVKDPSKCITRIGSIRIQINDCDNNKRKFQQWVYSVTDRKISIHKNQKLQMTVHEYWSRPNQVQLRTGKVPVISKQTWELEEII